ncbi:MAG: sulfur transferase domain-containing protein [Gammaproteobacteria bacterium]|nr:sulfur transferase domain-containing protein [Gammaproteobacteria bacterium]MDH4256008.1 sulfur transferase domain-containing protein [Gammaproteobacteria bacterium]MDH5308724.1 sulfur transferase domain-containing protein [Gammaproteobacteria bacterium]
MTKKSFIILALLFALPALPQEFEHEPVVTLGTPQILNDASVLPGSGLVSTGQPNAEVLEAAAKAGYVAVVDMRLPEEDRGIDERAVTERLGMSYVAFPIGAPDTVTWENAAALDEILAGFDGPVLMHCASGNRVGALLALRAKANGASSEQALEIGKQGGLTRYEKVVRERLELE